VPDTERAALVHEWIDSRAGSEKVFEALAGVLPDADLYALTREPGVDLDLGSRSVTTTFLDQLPGLRARRGLTLPLMPIAWHRIRAPVYELVITSSHAFARWFRPARDALHLSYVHSPARYLWTPELDRRNWVSGLIAKVAAPLRRLDRRSLDWTDSIAANSTAVAERIHEFYGREAHVIHPPVDLEHYRPRSSDKRGYALCVSRFVPYKRIDLAIAACARAGLPLVVAGFGPAEAELRALAAGTATTFVSTPDDEALAKLYSEADVVIYPGEEDFGIVPVEAQACGTPVLAFGRGGSRDTVIPGTTGALIERQEVAMFAEALADIDWSAFEADRLHEHAQRFGYGRFRTEIRAWIGSARG
jgi:glycosyltransferase involved in cell wall biosynthesis